MFNDIFYFTLIFINFLIDSLELELLETKSPDKTRSESEEFPSDMLFTKVEMSELCLTVARLRLSNAVFKLPLSSLNKFLTLLMYNIRDAIGLMPYKSAATVASDKARQRQRQKRARSRSHKKGGTKSPKKKRRHSSGGDDGSSDSAPSGDESGSQSDGGNNEDDYADKFFSNVSDRLQRATDAVLCALFILTSPNAVLFPFFNVPLTFRIVL